MRPLTLALYNSYDARKFHEAMRRAAARAAPLADAFGFHLALVGFPFSDYRDRHGEHPETRTPAEVAVALSDSTSIGQARRPLVRLADAGRLHIIDDVDKGPPAQMGTLVLATSRPDPAKRMDAHQVAQMLPTRPIFVLIGLGPRGVPKRVRESAVHHLEVSGADVSLETATAMGVICGRLAEAMRRPTTPRLGVDAIVVRDGRLLLVRRGRPPHVGSWALPGGFVETHETTEAAVLRELAEETGIVGGRSQLIGVFSTPGRDPRGPVATIAYSVEAGPGPVRAGDDASEAQFHHLHALPKLAFDHAEIVGRALSARDGSFV